MTQTIDTISSRSPLSCRIAWVAPWFAKVYPEKTGQKARKIIENDSYIQQGMGYSSFENLFHGGDGSEEGILFCHHYCKDHVTPVLLHIQMASNLLLGTIQAAGIDL